MSLILLISLLSQTPSTEPSASIDYTTAECWAVSGVGISPRNKVYRSLHLEPVRVEAGGILFPEETARNVLWRLLCLEKWPEMAQAKLDELEQVGKFELWRERELVEQLRARPPVREGVSWTTAAGIGAVGVAVGLVIGFVAK